MREIWVDSRGATHGIFTSLDEMFEYASAHNLMVWNAKTIDGETVAYMTHNVVPDLLETA